jgi:hypothetical protein
MDLGVTERLKPILEDVRAFIKDRVLPVDEEFLDEVDNGDRWTLNPRQLEILEGLKSEARKQGLWNFWLTDSDRGPGLTTVEYAYIAEETGRAHLAAECFNCSAPDTGNMEVLERYGSDAQKAAWLEPLLNGEIRSAYAMSEPAVASSDATNIAMTAVAEGDEWLINGEKTYISGAGDKRCKILICMVKTNPENDRHQQHSQILVPMDAPGVHAHLLYRRSCSCRQHHSWPGSWFRGCTGASRARSNSPLHACDRNGRGSTGANVQTIGVQDGVRQTPGKTRWQLRQNRKRAHGHRYGTPADTAHSACHRYAWRWMSSMTRSRCMALPDCLMIFRWRECT